MMNLWEETLVILTLLGKAIPPVVNILPIYPSRVSKPKTYVYIQEKIGISEEK
jgi:hypothetical protein